MKNTDVKTPASVGFANTELCLGCTGFVLKPGTEGARGVRSQVPNIYCSMPVLQKGYKAQGKQPVNVLRSAIVTPTGNEHGHHELISSAIYRWNMLVCVSLTLYDRKLLR